MRRYVPFACLLAAAATFVVAACKPPEAAAPAQSAYGAAAPLGPGDRGDG